MLPTSTDKLGATRGQTGTLILVGRGARRPDALCTQETPRLSDASPGWEDGPAAAARPRGHREGSEPANVQRSKAAPLLVLGEYSARPRVQLLQTTGVTQRAVASIFCLHSLFWISRESCGDLYNEPNRHLQRDGQHLYLGTSKPIVPRILTSHPEFPANHHANTHISNQRPARFRDSVWGQLG